MHIIELMGMSSTKYGGLEKYNIELVKICSKHIYHFVYDTMPENQNYCIDIKKNGAFLHILPHAGKLLNITKYILHLVALYRIDIIHFHFKHYAIAPIIKILHPHIKLIVTYHCEIKYFNIFRVIERKFYKLFFNNILCVSNGVKDSAIKILGNSSKYQVLYLGCKNGGITNSHLKKELNISNECIILTTIGFDFQIKGIDILIESIKILKEKTRVHSFKVLIVGFNDINSQKLISILKKYGLSDTFISLGVRNDIDNILNITDIYLQPSRSEGISLSIMEALNHGIPIIGSNVGGIPEVVIDNYNGLLFSMGNALELSEKIELLLNDINLRKSFGEKSKILSYKFNIYESIKKLSSLYNSYK